MHVEAITHRKNAIVPMTIVGVPRWRMDIWEKLSGTLSPSVEVSTQRCD